MTILCSSIKAINITQQKQKNENSVNKNDTRNMPYTTNRTDIYRKHGQKKAEGK